jgi:enoyl-[acyl-carrier-protein] reductase (NADH)
MAYNLLKGKRGIIFGALDEKSMAWQIALKCHEEGATFTLSNAPIALRMGKINELASACGNATVIGADATSLTDLENVFSQSMEVLGGKIESSILIDLVVQIIQQVFYIRQFIMKQIQQMQDLLFLNQCHQELL